MKTNSLRHISGRLDDIPQPQEADLVFSDNFKEVGSDKYADYCIHVLCHEGYGTFVMGEKEFKMEAGDLVIWISGKSVSDIRVSDDFRATVFYLSYRFSYLNDSKNDYRVKGHLALLHNPVLRLTPEEVRLCDTALLSIRQHTEGMEHAYRRESLGFLVESFKLDLFGIHARMHEESAKQGQAEYLFRRFVDKLETGSAREHREVAYYASELCITPKYLSQICIKASGRNASDWINRFAMNELTELLKDKRLSLNDIADRMRFSSPSYFSRFVRNNTGLSPSEYRQKAVEE